MGEIERVLMAEGERAQDFRRSVIGTIGARALESAQATPDYGEIFKAYLQRLREDFYAKRKKVLRRMLETFLRYASDERGKLDDKERAHAKDMLTALEGRYGYCERCARDTVAYLLKKRYAE